MDRKNAYTYYEQRELLHKRGDQYMQQQRGALSPGELAGLDMLNARIARDPYVMGRVKGIIRVLKRGGRPQRMGEGWVDEDS